MKKERAPAIFPYFLACEKANKFMSNASKQLTTDQRKEFFKNLNYLNISEYQGFCLKHKIPFHIYYLKDDVLKKSNEKDRKKIVLARIKKFLETGKISKPTIFKSNVVNFSKVQRWTASSHIHFGQYDKTSASFMAELKKLTQNKFKDGMIARVVIRDLWSHGKAPTLKEFAKTWMAATKANPKKHAEFAYLSDLTDGKANADWKAVRIKKANAALKILNNL